MLGTILRLFTTRTATRPLDSLDCMTGGILAVCRAMRNLQTIISILLFFQCSLGFAEQSQFTLVHDGSTRSYEVFKPSSYTEDTPAPVLIALHGRNSSGQRMADLTRFNLRAEVHGFIAVYPDGLDRQWNYLHGAHPQAGAPNDSEFLLKIKQDLRTRLNIDAARVYVVGISNGGFMTQRLACYAPNEFAGFASVAAGGFAEMPSVCQNGAPINLLIMHGTADSKVPWRGIGIQDSQGNKQLITLSIANTMKYWTTHNRCGPGIDHKEITPAGNSTGTKVKIFTSSNCADSASVVLYAIIGGGHNWPGVANFIPPDIAGLVNLDIHASDVVWEFFRTSNLLGR